MKFLVMKFFQIPFTSSVLDPNSSLSNMDEGRKRSDAVSSYFGHRHSVAGRLKSY
jgi:hypothetical protein